MLRLTIDLQQSAQLLDTSPDELIEMIEDYALGKLMDEVEDDEVLEGDASWHTYQEYLHWAKLMDQ